MAEEMFVEVAEPDRQPRRVVLEGPVEFGRECDGEIINDLEVSRRHLKMLPSPNGLRVVDLGSSNGTTVNGVPVSEPTTVQPGDVIRMGRTSITVGNPKPPPPPKVMPPSDGPRSNETIVPAAASATIRPERTTMTPGAAPAAAPTAAPAGPGRPAPAAAALAGPVERRRPKFTGTTKAMARQILGLDGRRPLRPLGAVVLGAVALVALAGQLHRVGALVPLKSVSGVFAMALLLAASGVAQASFLAGEVRHGFIDRLVLSTSHRFPLILGCMIADFIMGVVVAIPLLLIAWALGLTFATGIGGAVVMVVIAGAWAAAYGAFFYGLAFTNVEVSLSSLEYAVIAVLLFFSPALLPRSALGGWFSHVVAVNPLTYLVDAMNALQSDRWDGGAIVKAVIVLVLVGLVGLILAGIAVRNRVRAMMGSETSAAAPAKPQTPEQSEAEMLRQALESERLARQRLEERLGSQK